MARTPILSTRVLLICAAIGVATGILGGIGAWVTPFVILTAPILYGLVLGVHVLPGIIAQETLRLPGVAIISHLIAALAGIATTFGAFAWQFLGTAVLFGGIQELVAAIVRYRSWAPWRFFISAFVIGVVVAAAVFFAAHLSTLALWAQITYLVLALLSPVAWTAVALAIGASLRRAGVARRA